MIGKSENIRITKNNIFFLSSLVLLVILIELAVVQIAGEYALFVLAGINIAILVAIVLSGSEFHLPMLLIVINLIPLIYLNERFHYWIKWIIFQDVPLFILSLLALFKYVGYDKPFNFDLKYLRLPLIVLTVYAVFSMIVGIQNNNPRGFIINEIYHFFYYSFSIVIFYLIKERKYYKYIFISITVIAGLIAAEYLVIYKLSGWSRVVTFQSGIFIIALSIVFAYLILKKPNFIKKSLIIGTFIFIFVGLILTLTRSLWVSGFVALLSIGALYLHLWKGISKIKISALIIIVLLPVFILGMRSDSKNIQRSASNEIKYRTESLANPTGDQSFLMRIELGYYIIIKFLESPIIGKGLGDTIKYKILSTSNLAVNYPDNSWLFVLWKGGIIGLLLFLWLYFRLFTQTYYILKNTQNIEVKIMTLAILGALAGLMVYSLFTAVLIKYKINIILAIIIAYVEYERRELNVTLTDK
ncbi:MAG: hypothetical protein BMS9Abin39_0407 [Ignavibacteria bacterium]|nr:MAG: hypothetical protein BMS9Abin39_0407 [Ignavibacteria bacterium]